MMQLESEFLTASNEKVVMILDQVAWRNVIYIASSGQINQDAVAAYIDSIIRANELTHSNPCNFSFYDART